MSERALRNLASGKLNCFPFSGASDDKPRLPENGAFQVDAERIHRAVHLSSANQDECGELAFSGHLLFPHLTFIWRGLNALTRPAVEYSTRLHIGTIMHREVSETRLQSLPLDRGLNASRALCHIFASFGALFSSRGILQPSEY